MSISGLHQATKQLKQGATFSTLGATTPNSFTAESATDCVGFALKAWWTWKPVNSRWVILSGKKYHSNNNSITLFPKECNLDDLSQYDVQNLPKTYNISINMLHICVYVLCGYVSKWGAHHPVVFLQMDPWVSQVWGIKSFGEWFQGENPSQRHWYPKLAKAGPPCFTLSSEQTVLISCTPKDKLKASTLFELNAVSDLSCKRSIW